MLTISKTKCMVFRPRHMLVSYPQLILSLGRKPVEQVKKSKLIDIMLDAVLTRTEHIDKIVTKMDEQKLAVVMESAKGDPNKEPIWMLDEPLHGFHISLGEV